MTSTITAGKSNGSIGPVMFCHANQHPARRFTLAYVETDEKFVAAFAVCSETDQYVKKTGRQLSETRLNDFLATGVGKHAFEINKANFPRVNRRGFLQMALALGYHTEV